MAFTNEKRRGAWLTVGICAAVVVLGCALLHGLARGRRGATLSARTEPPPLRASGAAELIVRAASADEALSPALGQRIAGHRGEGLGKWPGFVVTSHDVDGSTGAEAVLGRGPAAQENSLWYRTSPMEKPTELGAGGGWSWDAFVLWTGRDYEFLTARGTDAQGTGTSPLAPALYWQLCRINVSQGTAVVVPGGERLPEVTTEDVNADRSQACIVARDDLLLVDLPDGAARSLWERGTRPGVPVAEARYSPDGGLIAFNDRWGSSPDPRKGAFVTSVETGRWRQLTFATGLNSHHVVRWAPPRTVLVMRHVPAGRGSPRYELWSVQVGDRLLAELCQEP